MAIVDSVTSAVRTVGGAATGAVNDFVDRAVWDQFGRAMVGSMRATVAVRKKKASGADYFLKLTDIEGESKDTKHKGEIEIVSFEFGASQAGTAGRGGGSGAGKASFGDMTFAMTVDKAYPKLALACVTGEHIKEATFVARKAGGRQEVYLLIKLTEVLISSINLADHGVEDPIPVVLFTLNFGEIDIEYKEQTSNGTVAAATKVGYNLKTNKKK